MGSAITCWPAADIALKSVGEVMVKLADRA